MSDIEILCYGWFGKKNVGDQLFKEAFEYLFPQYNFVFTDKITKHSLYYTDVVFIGGGSFLHAALNIDVDCMDLLKTKKIFYIGVGSETVIHPQHKEILSIAKLVAIRNTVRLQEITALNPNTIIIPDLVYSLQPKSFSNPPTDNSVLILPNISVVPNWKDENWKHQAWNYFKCEFSQFLDYLLETSHEIKFLPMCQNNQDNDISAAYEIINQMKYKDNYILNGILPNFNLVNDLFSKYNTIITQRFHGIVLSEITNRPFISLYHHDKLKDGLSDNGIFLSYYGINKQILIDNFNKIKHKNYNFSIDKNVFNMLQEKVISHI